jgi:WD40 repeat protein
VALSPAGDQLATLTPGKVAVWDRATGARFAEAAVPRLRSVSFRGDGRAILASGEETLLLWELSEARPVALLGHHARIADAVFSGDGARIVSSDESGMICLWDARSGRLLRTTKLPGGATLHAGGDGGHAAAHTRDGLWVWDIHLAGSPTPRGRCACRPTYSPATASCRNGSTRRSSAARPRQRPERTGRLRHACPAGRPFDPS